MAQQVTSNGTNLAAMQAEIARLQTENAQLRQASTQTSRISFKVSEKGACSVYGLQRMPVTLYRTQWDRLIAAVPELQAFLATNKENLVSRKEQEASQ